jgi:hypothetical protein
MLCYGQHNPSRTLAHDTPLGGRARMHDPNLLRLFPVSCQQRHPKGEQCARQEECGSADGTSIHKYPVLE